MLTDNVKFGEGAIYIKDSLNTVIGKLGNCVCVEDKSGDNELDALDGARYFAEFIEKQKELSLTISVAAENIIKLKRALGIEKITRKRFIKLLMGYKIQRNDAIKIAEIVHKKMVSYSLITVQSIIKTYEERCKCNGKEIK